MSPPTNDLRSRYFVAVTVAALVAAFRRSRMIRLILVLLLSDDGGQFSAESRLFGVRLPLVLVVAQLLRPALPEQLSRIVGICVE